MWTVLSGLNYNAEMIQNIMKRIHTRKLFIPFLMKWITEYIS